MSDQPGWRAVAVLDAHDAATGRAVTAVLRVALEAYAVRVYVSGGSLVVVTTVPAPSPDDGVARLTAALADVLPPSVRVDDVWSGRAPLAAPSRELAAAG